MPVSEIIDLLPPSPIRKLTPFAQKAQKKGIRIYHLNIGDPDIKTPKVMINALKNWQKNPISYVDSKGLDKLLNALVWYYQKKAGLKITTDNLQITTGGSEAIYWSMLATANPGQEILVFEPFYANYNGFAIQAKIKLVPIQTSIENGFHLPSQEKITSKITSQTKAILITNPNNPTGTIYTKKELELLVKIAKKHHLYLIADETYREFSYQDKKTISLYSYQNNVPSQIIIIDSLSKRYSLCGARIGCILTDNKKLLKGFLKLAQTRLCAGLIDQVVASQLIKVKDSYFKKNILKYKKRRDILYQGLKKIPQIICQKPEGAFYLIVKLPVKNSQHFAKWLLTSFHYRKETIMLAPAAGFYATKNMGKSEVRLAYVLNQKKLKKSINIFKIALSQYKNSQ